MATKIAKVRDGQAVNNSQWLIVVSCPTCHIEYAIPSKLKDYLEERPKASHHGARWSSDGEETFCPNGHTWTYVGKSMEQRLEDERNRRAAIAAQRDQARAERDHEAARARAEKAAKTRFKNQRDKDRTRIKNGVCPCCNRSFKNVRRHMASQHPDFPPPDDH
jgi:hypothetical protein